MKSITYIFGFFLFFSCGIHKNDIEFKILNNEVNNNDYLNLEIINNSKKDYFLPFNLENENWNKNSELFPQIYIVDEKDNKAKLLMINCSDYDYYPGYGSYVDYIKKNFEARKQNILKSKSVLKFKVHFMLKKDNPECEGFEYIINSKMKNYLFIEYKYHEKTIKLYEKWGINYDSLTQDKYKIYKGEISSNRVPLILKK